MEIALAFCLHKFCPCGIPVKSAKCASIKEDWRPHPASDQHVCWDCIWWADIKQKDQVLRETAVENLLKSKYLTYWEVENISPMCLVFLKHLRLMDSHKVFPSPFLIIKNIKLFKKNHYQSDVFPSWLATPPLSIKEQDFLPSLWKLFKTDISRNNQEHWLSRYQSVVVRRESSWSTEECSMFLWVTFWLIQHVKEKQNMT